MDLSAAVEGVIEVTNKPSRVEDFIKAIEELRERGWLSQANAASLRGRVTYAEGQLFSRVAAVMLPDLRRRAMPGALGMRVTAFLLDELTWMRDFMIASIPRRIRASDGRRPVVVMTDAYLSDNCDRAGIGAVLLNGRGEAIRFISEEVPAGVLKIIQAETKHVITALEVLPVYFVRVAWNTEMVHRRCFIFVDNDGARHSLLRCTSGSQSVLRVLRKVVLLQAEWPCFTWYSRVPSPANIADDPSRGNVTDLMESGVSRHKWTAALGAKHCRKWGRARQRRSGRAVPLFI